MNRGAQGRPKRLTRLLITFAVGIIFGTLWSGILLLSGVIEPTSTLELSGVGITIPSIVVEFITGFVFGVVLAVVYFSLHRRIRQIGAWIKEQWIQLSDIAKAIVVGLLVAIVADISIGLTDLLGSNIPAFFEFGVFVIAWLIASSSTFRQLQERELSEWIKAIGAGGLIAGAAAVGIAWFGTLNYVPLLVFLLGWPLTTFFVYRKRILIWDQLVERGIVQWMQFHLLTVALVIGFVAAVIVGLGAQFLGIDGRLTAFVFVFVWIVGVAITYLIFRTSPRPGLVFEVEERTLDPNMELTVENTGDEEVNLHGAIVRDTQYKTHQWNKEVTIAPGQEGIFNVPPHFAPDPPDINNFRPSGFTIIRAKETPDIFTRSGKRFRLQRSEDQQRQGENGLEDETRMLLIYF